MLLNFSPSESSVLSHACLIWFQYFNKNNSFYDLSEIWISCLQTCVQLSRKLQMGGSVIELHQVKIMQRWSVITVFDLI